MVFVIVVVAVASAGTAFIFEWKHLNWKEFGGDIGVAIAVVVVAIAVLLALFTHFLGYV